MRKTPPNAVCLAEPTPEEIKEALRRIEQES